MGQRQNFACKGLVIWSKWLPEERLAYFRDWDDRNPFHSRWKSNNVLLEFGDLLQNDTERNNMIPTGFFRYGIQPVAAGELHRSRARILYIYLWERLTTTECAPFIVPSLKYLAFRCSGKLRCPKYYEFFVTCSTNDVYYPKCSKLELATFFIPTTHLVTHLGAC